VIDQLPTTALADDLRARVTAKLNLARETS
jgi:hypothetical protein